MSAQEDVEEFIQLVRSNPQVANIAGGYDEDLIIRAEEQLGITLPPTYREFVRQFGECDVAGEEFYGVWTREDDHGSFFGAVRTTLEARRASAMPSPLIASMSDGMGGLYVLDTASLDEDSEASVLIWEPGGSVPGGTAGICGE